MKKIKEYKVIIIIVLIVVLGSFYWFQLRPTNIRKNCSQKITIIPADIGVTKEQAEQNKIDFDQCKLKYPAIPFMTNNSLEFYIYMRDMENKFSETQKNDINRCKGLIRNTIERNPSPERKEISNELNENKYNQCLRQHGL